MSFFFHQSVKLYGIIPIVQIVPFIQTFINFIFLLPKRIFLTLERLSLRSDLPLKAPRVAKIDREDLAVAPLEA